MSLIDGLVLARSAMHHSANYRSVMLLGPARPVEDRAEKLRRCEAIVEHIVPGRWREVREPTENELAATAFLALPIEEASAKVRTGRPIDDEQDYELRAVGRRAAAARASRRARSRTHACATASRCPPT